jgi:hypothetical protein
MTATLTLIMDIGSDAVSVLFFVIWVFQILRCGYYYTKYGIDTGFNIAFIHVILFTANALYLLYEFIQNDHNPIWLIFTMYFLVDVA